MSQKYGGPVFRKLHPHSLILLNMDISGDREKYAHSFLFKAGILALNIEHTYVYNLCYVFVSNGLRYAKIKERMNCVYEYRP